MNRIVDSIASLAEHVIAVVTDAEQYRPDACPHCGRAGVWRHGCYHRKADRSAGGGQWLNPQFLPRAGLHRPFAQKVLRV